MKRRRLVSIEEIYGHFDVPHIRRLMEYSDRRDPINTDNVIVMKPLFEELGDENVQLIGDQVDYEAKVTILENQLRVEREAMAGKANVDKNPSYVQAVTDDSNENVEIPKSLLKQLINVLNNNKDKK